MWYVYIKNTFVYFFKLGCGTEFRGDQIGEVCASGGMIPASLDDPHLAEELVKQINSNFDLSIIIKFKEIVTSL